MNRSVLNFALLLMTFYISSAQDIIPIDTLHWKIESESYVLEPYKGKDAIYLKQGSMTLKDAEFLNGTIEYDIFLKEARGFPGIYFRTNDQNAEQFYIRPHQSGNPDANQVLPITNGLASWQLYHGPKYSFPYHYNYKDWTHVKLVINNDLAQLYLDHAERPQLSWKLFHEPMKGGITLTGGGDEALHLANIVVNPNETTITDFKPGEQKEIEGLIPSWEISDKFEEGLLEGEKDPASVIGARTWEGSVQVEEGTAANIARLITLRGAEKGNTVLARVTINSSKDQLKLFEFGYSDRVVVILNGVPIYRGTNRFNSRDYRYLGTIGLFDAVYLPLKKGDNTLIMAVSEDFGGWLITGRFPEAKGLKVTAK